MALHIGIWGRTGMADRETPAPGLVARAISSRAESPGDSEIAEIKRKIELSLARMSRALL
jgi:hypothetical protein